MINAHRTGAYISQLRKARDWTQLDLAEKLHITHQAVSQWEKGAAFPDIGLLPALARLLGVTVDDLLNGEPSARQRRVSPGQIVESLARDEPREAARLVQQLPEGPRAMVEAAPLARPSQLNALVGSLPAGERSFTLEQVAELAPFVSRAVLGDLLDRAALDELDGDRLLALAPFAEAATLAALLDRLAPQALSLDQVRELAPFVGRDRLKALLFARLEGAEPPAPDLIEDLASFLDKDALDELVRRLPADPLPLPTVTALAPHLHRATLGRLIAAQPDTAELGQYLEDLAPFVGAERLRQLVLQQRAALTTSQVLDLAPFLDRETLEALLQRGAHA